MKKLVLLIIIFQFFIIDLSAQIQIHGEIDKSNFPNIEFVLHNRNPEISAINDFKLTELVNGKFEFNINGSVEKRIPNNLNIAIAGKVSEQLFNFMPHIALSSGSACTSASLEPSYVLRAIGLNDELAHSSLRISIGRFTTEEEIDFAIGKVREAVAKLRELSPLWDMYKDGVDLNQVKWAAH